MVSSCLSCLLKSSTLQIGLDPSTECMFVLGILKAPARFVIESCDPNLVELNAFTLRFILSDKYCKQNVTYSVFCYGTLMLNSLTPILG